MLWDFAVVIWELKAWFPYRFICRICRVCRTKKIHKTATILWKPPVQMLNTKETTDTTFCFRDGMNSICPLNFFHTTDTTDTTDTTIWKPRLSNHDDDGNKERHKFAYLTMKNNSFARFARAFFIFGNFADVLVLSTT